MLATKSILISISVFCFGFLFAQGHSKPVFDEIIDGKHIVIPYFEDDVTNFSPEQRELGINTWNDLEKLVFSAVKHILVDKKSYVRLTGFPLKLYTILKKSKSTQNELLKEGRAYEEKNTWFPECLKTYQDVKEFSKEESQTKISAEMSELSQDAQEKKFYEDFKNFISIFGKVIRQSPVATYLEWRSMTVDGVPIAKVSSYYYSYFRDNGFSGALWLVDQAIGRLGSLVG